MRRVKAACVCQCVCVCALKMKVEAYYMSVCIENEDSHYRADDKHTNGLPGVCLYL